MKTPTGSVQRYLSYLTLFLIGASVLASIAIMVCTGIFHLNLQTAQSSAWSYLFGLPLVALPLGVACIIALFIVNAVQRSRANQKAAK